MAGSNGGVIPTSSLRASKSYREQEEEERKAKDLAERTKRAEIPRRFRHATFAEIEKRGLPDNKSIRYNYEKVKAYAKDIRQNLDNGYGMILAGGPGTLKTTMAVAVLHHWIEEGGRGCAFVPMPSLIDELYTLRNRDRREESSLLDRIRNARLLLLDDLGGENWRQDWIMAKVDDLVTKRYNDELSTIVTTNFTMQELKDTYAARIMDRFKSTCWYLEFAGGSQRPALM